MARTKFNKIQFKRGNKVNLPALKDAEPAVCLDTKQLFVGCNGQNVQFVSKTEMDSKIETEIAAAPLQKNPMFTLTLSASGWTQSGTTYTKAISDAAIVSGAKLNIGPGNDTMISRLITDGVTSMWVKNNNGAATVVMVDGKPGADVSAQIEVVPTKGSGIIYGNPVSLSGGSGFVALSTAPTNTRLLWIDTNNGLMKYYSGSTWKGVGAIYG